MDEYEIMILSAEEAETLEMLYEIFNLYPMEVAA